MLFDEQPPILARPSSAIGIGDERGEGRRQASPAVVRTIGSSSPNGLSSGSPSLMYASAGLPQAIASTANPPYQPISTWSTTTWACPNALQHLVARDALDEVEANAQALAPERVDRRDHVPRALDVDVGRGMRDDDLVRLRLGRRKNLARIEARIRTEGRPGQPFPQIGVEIEHAIREAQRPARRRLPVPVEREAVRPCHRDRPPPAARQSPGR